MSNRVDEILDSLGNDLDPSVLIGGWGTRLLVGGEVSKDIDLIITQQDLRTRLHEVVSGYSENAIHSNGVKGRGTVKDVHIDAYIPYESRLGERLQLRVERLIPFSDSNVVRGWKLLSVSAHLATKIAALLDRPNTEKGEKDAREILSLLNRGATAEETITVILEATALPPVDVPGLITTLFELLPDRARVNKSVRRELAALKREWVDEAEFQSRKLRAAEPS